MKYSTKEIADMSGLTVRTLHYYDEIDLLKPKRSLNNYRIYDSDDVVILQRVLFYKGLGFSLDRIKTILSSSNLSFYDELQTHIDNLLIEKSKIDNTIKMIKRVQKEDENMNDNERLEIFKQNKIENNEKNYGNELRQKYGDDFIDSYNQSFANLSNNNIDDYNNIGRKIIDLLINSVKNNDKSHDKDIFNLHQNWLKLINKNYSKDYHIYMAKMYLDDDRFTNYYDSRAGKGAAKRLSSIIMEYLK